MITNVFINPGLATVKISNFISSGFAFPIPSGSGIAEKDGGNVDCSKPPVNGDDNGDNGDGLDLDTSKIFFYLILIVGAILIIIGGRKFLKS